jgi:surfeit locus 1 family protein
VTRLKQALIVAIGLALAAGMVLLGLWQLDVYHSQGTRSAQARAGEPPVPLDQVAPPGAAASLGFGRSVQFQGRYDRTLQLMVPLGSDPGAYRVLTGLLQADGSIVPVVRGVFRGSSAPPPPAGPLNQTGVLLPSEDNDPVVASGRDQLSSVRLPSLAQLWPGELIGGFVTLSASDAVAQGLEPAPVELPAGQGRLRNAAYALQWWLFAAFAVAMAIRMARDVGYQEDVTVTDAGRDLADIQLGTDDLHNRAT